MIHTPDYDLIYSIGTDCACSMYMLRHNLRTVAGPFDWLTHADFKTRIELILSDFDNFLECEDLKFLPKDPKIFNDTACDYYENIRNGFYYFHDFPANIPLKKSFQEVKNKYQRRIQRFLNNLKQPDKILLLWISNNSKVAPEEALKLCTKIREKFGNHIDFLMIEHDENKKDGEIEENILAPFLTLYKIFGAAFDDNGYPLTLGNISNHTPILAQIRCKGRLKRLWKKRLNKFWVKFICFFIPYRPWRKALKKKLLIQ